MSLAEGESAFGSHRSDPKGLRIASVARKIAHFSQPLMDIPLRRL